MRIEEEVIVHRKRTVSVTCDICGDEIKDNLFIDRTVESSVIYPEYCTRLNYDVCTECWGEKIVPLFSTGPRESDF